MPLSISLALDQRGMDFTLLDTMVTFAKRWEHVHLTGTGARLDALEEDLKPRDMPLLRTLTLDMDHSPATLATLAVLRAPSLTGLTITRMTNGPLLQLPVRWRNITDLAFGGFMHHGFDGGAAVELLRHCPNLRSCTLTLHNTVQRYMGQRHMGSFPGPGAHAAPNVEPPSVELIHLHALRLSVNSDGGVGDALSIILPLLTNLVAPNLRIFQLFNASSYIDYNTSSRNPKLSLSSFFMGCPRLERVFLDATILSKNSLVDALRSLPDTTTHLDILDQQSNRGPRMDRHVLRLFKPASGAAASLNSRGAAPALVSLVIRGCALLTARDAVELYRARRGIRSVVIDFGRPRDTGGDDHGYRSTRVTELIRPAGNWTVSVPDVEDRDGALDDTAPAAGLKLIYTAVQDGVGKERAAPAYMGIDVDPWAAMTLVKPHPPQPIMVGAYIDFIMTCSQEEMMEVEQMLGLYVDEFEKLDDFDILSDLCSDSDTEDDTRLLSPPSSDSPQSSESSLDMNMDATQEDAPAGTTAAHTETKADEDRMVGVETASKQRGASWRASPYAALHSAAAGTNLPVRRVFQAAPTRILIPTNSPGPRALLPPLLTPNALSIPEHNLSPIASQNTSSEPPHVPASHTFCTPTAATHTSTPNAASSTRLLSMSATEPRSLGTFCAAPTPIVIPGAAPRSRLTAHSKTVQEAKSSRRLLGF
ncbi:hypothetical protein MKEN_00485100 [Mycena kentingensis (nom. inval.)]|nr:hypothetical protein MKEN_00485100 [Mycena kentingensis (nom. inval.)]